MKYIETEHAPSPVGPYSQAVEAGGLVFVSGQLGVNPQTGSKVEGGVQKETEQALKNIEAILKAAGVTLKDVTKVTVYLTDMNDFSSMNAVYSTFFSHHKPARACVEVNLLKGFHVEIDAIAAKR